MDKIDQQPEGDTRNWSDQFWWRSLDPSQRDRQLKTQLNWALVSTSSFSNGTRSLALDRRHRRAQRKSGQQDQVAAVGMPP
jgi:hypothetical protein